MTNTLTSMLTHAIALRAVSKSFGGQRVIDGLNLSVPEHAIFALVGSNGEGKSTVIRLITGLLQPDSGQIEVLGQAVGTARNAILSHVGVSVDTPALYPNLTAEEFLSIGCMAKGLPGSEIGRVLDLLDLAKARKRQLARYSPCMKQRLAIAHALLGSPKLLVLDEPGQGLDPTGARDVRRLLKSLPAISGMTIFMSSHNLDEVEQVATHVGVLRHGAIERQAPIDDLLGELTGALAIDVGNPARARQLLTVAGYRVERRDDGQLRVCGLARHQGDKVHALLVHAGISLYQSVYVRPTLSQWFLEDRHG